MGLGLTWKKVQSQVREFRLMSTGDLESEFARVSVGVLPAASVPKGVVQKIELVGWEHGKYPGLMWRIPNQSLPEIRFHSAGLIEGFKIQDFEKVAIVIEDRVRAVIPSGDWILKRGSRPKEEEAEEIKKMAFIWIDMRQFEALRRIPDVRTEDGVTFDAQCTILFRVTNPATLVTNLVLEAAMRLATDLDEKIHDVIEEATISEIVKNTLEDLSSKSAELLKEALTTRMSNWGMEVVSVRLEGLPDVRKEAIPSVKREPVPVIQIPRIPAPSIATRTFAKSGSRARRDRSISSETEWEGAPKRWVPQVRKGEVKCDGCGSDADWFSECDIVCRSSNRCSLCKDCFMKRKMCAFS